jgi:signal transduction histidine kinase
MKKLITFIIIIFSVTNLCAQNKKIDELKLQLSKVKTDTGRIKLLINMGSRFGFGQAKNDSALWYLQEALELSKKIHYHKGEIYARQGMANFLRYTGNYPEALKLSLENLKTAEQYHQYDALFYQTRLIGWIYGDMGDNKKCLEYAKKLAVLAHSKDYKAYEETYTATANNCISMAYLELNMLDSGLHYRHLVYQFALKKKDPQWLLLAANGLGNSYAKKGNTDSAFFFYRMANPIAKKAQRRDVAASAELGMAELFHKAGQSDSAFFYTRQSLDELQNTDAPASVMDAYSLLAKMYKSNHQSDSAYKYMERFVTLKDSLFNQNKIAQAQNFAFNETLQQQQIQRAKEDAQQQYKNRLKIYTLAGIILIFLIIAFLLIRNLRNKRKANELLHQKNEEIQSTLSELKSTQKQLIQSEKMASLGELTAGIAHEIQNPLNFVNNFSEVNTEMLEELKAERSKPKAERDEQLEDAILKDIKENEQKINHHGKRADAIVKGMLQHSRKSSGQKEPTDINALADEYLRLSYHGLRAKDKNFNATIETNFDKSIGKINVIPQDIGRVLLNLYNNAFYAVNEQKNRNPDSYQPTVSVTTKKSDDKIQIVVKDNGNGIPQKIVEKIFQPFFTTKPTGEGTGLGLSLAYDIVKAHGGELKVETKENEGSEFIIQVNHDSKK